MQNRAVSLTWILRTWQFITKYLFFTFPVLFVRGRYTLNMKGAQVYYSFNSVCIYNHAYSSPLLPTIIPLFPTPFSILIQGFNPKYWPFIFPHRHSSTHWIAPADCLQHQQSVSLLKRYTSKRLCTGVVRWRQQVLESGAANLLVERNGVETIIWMVAD